MLAAPVWHYWIGLLLLIVTVLGVAALVVGYLKTVSAQRYPSARQDSAPPQVDQGS